MARTETANIVSFDRTRHARARAEKGEREYSGARERRSRDRAEARAVRMYDRQFGAVSDAQGIDDDDAPRAALYEGRMGSTHRKSARMQRSSTAGSPSAKVNQAGWSLPVNVTKRTLRVATGVLCAVLVCAILYVPAQQYYQAQREHDRLSAEYAVIEKRNNALDVQNDILASDAGMEDAVRQKYGYVKAGEETAFVTGLSEDATDTSRGSENVEANVLSSSVKAPEEWYTPWLDTLFGVE